MDGLILFLKKWINWKYALLALAAFGLVALVLQFLDAPLQALAGGQVKPDLRFGYDPTTIQYLFEVYGPQGRAIYIWDLAVDMLLPFFGALAGVLWVLLVVRSAAWQKTLINPPLVFLVTDWIENGLLFALMRSYPHLPAGLAELSSLVTQVKRSAYYLTAAEVIVCVMLYIFLAVRRKRGSH